MGLRQEVASTYESFIGSNNVRSIVLPNLAASITLTATAGVWTYGLGATIAAATVLTADAWLYRIDWENLSAPAAAYQIQIGYGVALSETWIAAAPVIGAHYDLPYIRIPAGTRIAGRCASSTGAADTIAVKIGLIQGFKVV